MALIDSVPTTRVTVPTFLVGKPNGQLDLTWLRAPDGSTYTHKKMFVPVSYAMQALHLASTLQDRSTGRYRSYQQQVDLFLSRYVTYDTGTGSIKYWNGKRYYKLPGVAMAATPGTSNHGLGLADDLAEETDGDVGLESMSDSQLTWMRDYAPKFGFGLETRSERWHWHWVGSNALTQLTVDVLFKNDIKIPSLSAFGFTVPTPTDLDPPPPAYELPTPPGYPSMSVAKGSTDGNTVVTGWAGGRVSILQRIIGVTADGYYGNQTAGKIMELQQTGGLTVDGVYGNQTMNKFIEWRGI